MKRISNKAAYRAIRKYYREHAVQIVFEKMKRDRGAAWHCNNVIKLDPREAILPTLIHELLHLAYPDEEEDWILKYEKYIKNDLTCRQYLYWLNLIYQNVQLDVRL